MCGTSMARGIGKFLTQPEVKGKLVSRGYDIVAGSPDDFDRMIAAEEARWLRLIK
jgi:tripartite-type tricarboxylate transporter receptor subunit TctC